MRFLFPQKMKYVLVSVNVNISNRSSAETGKLARIFHTDRDEETVQPHGVTPAAQETAG